MNKRPLTCAACLLALGAAVPVIADPPFPDVLPVNELRLDEGFRIVRAPDSGGAGTALASAGDVNGDGVDDILIGAWNASPGGGLRTGQTFVVFGDSDIALHGDLDLDTLDGSNGFVIDGVSEDPLSRWSIAGAGDINGDGFKDIVIGVPYVGLYPNEDRGMAFVIFGAADIGASGVIELASLDGKNGFAIEGLSGGDRLGESVDGAGDVNDDSIDDLILGAPGVFDRDDDFGAGRAYLIFGAAELGAAGSFDLDALDGDNGFRFTSRSYANNNLRIDGVGESVAGVGDFNGDDVDDLLIGAPGSTPDESARGEAYLIFGSADLGASGRMQVEDLTGANGFVVRTVDERFEDLGSIVAAAGDVDADDHADVIIGRPYFGHRSILLRGGSIVGASGAITIYESAEFGGHVIYGPCNDIACAGDMNADGLDDTLFGLRLSGGCNPFGGVDPGLAFALLGTPDPQAQDPVDLYAPSPHVIQLIGDAHELPPTDFCPKGSPYRGFGQTLSAAGDINDDGYDDFLLSVPSAPRVHVIFGRNVTSLGDLDDNNTVDATDLADLLTQWGPCAEEPSPCPADLDGSGHVTALDIAILLSYWTN